MTGVRCAAVMIVVALAGCTARSATLEQGTPAVHELARLSAAGALDAERLHCLTEALQSGVQALPHELDELRKARASLASVGMSDHARSVQQGMLAADAESDAARQRASDLRHVVALESQGLEAQASSARWHSADIAARAAEMALIVVGAPEGSQGLWSDTEARLLMEYADLMAQRPSEADAASRISARIAEIQTSHPQVMEGYAAMLLALYETPDLPCGSRDSSE